MALAATEVYWANTSGASSSVNLLRSRTLYHAFIPPPLSMVGLSRKPVGSASLSKMNGSSTSGWKPVPLCILILLVAIVLFQKKTRRQQTSVSLSLLTYSTCRHLLLLPLQSVPPNGLYRKKKWPGYAQPLPNFRSALFLGLSAAPPGLLSYRPRVHHLQSPCSRRVPLFHLPAVPLMLVLFPAWLVQVFLTGLNSRRRRL